MTRCGRGNQRSDQSLRPRDGTAGKRHLPTEGVEPTRPCGHWILSPARLPIPPRRLTFRDEWLTDFPKNARD
jgi:hypothetical protein